MENDIYILIGKNIKKRREEKDYTIKDLSIMLNVDSIYLEKIEKEGVDGNITFELLNRICNCLDITLLELLKKED